MEKPKVVVICGSTRFIDIMAVCAWLIEREENAICMGLHLLPGWYSRERIPDHLAEHENVKDKMDSLHFQKINLCDEIFVVNANDYIGESTANEIRYAQNTGKKIRWFTHDDIGDKCRSLIDAAVNRKTENDKLYQERKEDVLKAVNALYPWLEEEARIADELEREAVDVPTENVFTMLNICSFIKSFEMYGK